MQQIYLARQAIYDKTLAVQAYEVLYRGGQTNASGLDGAPADEGSQATSRVILNAFVELGLDRVSGNRPVFINVTESILLDSELELPVDRVVLEILETVRPTPEVVAATARLKEAGYRIALDDFEFSEDWAPLVEMSDIIKVDVMALGMDGVRDLLERLGDYPGQLLAEKVETEEEFAALSEMGFELFQGYFFCRPKLIEGRSLSGNKLGTLQLLAALRQPDVDLDDLEELIRQDVVLSYRLLRYLNSPFFGLSHKVDSVRQAIAMLGLRALRTWATLLALANVDDKPRELITMSLTRAKVCEMTARALEIDDADTYFTVGLFSLLDAMLDAPMDEVLRQLPLADELVEGILHGDGQAGRVLASARAQETGNWFKAKAFLGGTEVDLNTIYLDAVSWSDQVLASVN